jgi:hypothetical protein
MCDPIKGSRAGRPNVICSYIFRPGVDDGRRKWMEITIRMTCVDDCFQRGTETLFDKRERIVNYYLTRKAGICFVLFGVVCVYAV